MTYLYFIYKGIISEICVFVILCFMGRQYAVKHFNRQNHFLHDKSDRVFH